MIEIARQIADTVLAPVAEQVDRTTIPDAHFAALAEAGLFSLEALAPAEARRVMATIAGGCGATFFVWAQHHGVLRTLGSSDNEPLRSQLLTPLRSGSLLAGTAFAHVRRVGRPAVRSTRVDGGWRLDGKAPWATSWGIADRFCVAAESTDGEIIWAMLPGDGGPGVVAEPLDLPVFASTGTVALHFDGCAVADADVVTIGDAEAWRSFDRRRSAPGLPAVLGVADRAVRLMRDAGHVGNGGHRSDDDEATLAAGRLDTAIAAAWRHDDELTALLGQSPDDNATSDEGTIRSASDHRAVCLDVGQRATRALLAAVGGRGMDLSHPAQRLLREASFYVIQAQTSDGRSATLRSI